MDRAKQITITTEEEGMPTGHVLDVIGWTGFDQAVVSDPYDNVLLVLDPKDFEAFPRPFLRPIT